MLKWETSRCGLGPGLHASSLTKCIYPLSNSQGPADDTCRAGARFGVPATSKADYAVLHALNAGSPKLPKVMESQLHIAFVVAKYSVLLGQYESSSTGLLPAPHTLVRALDTELSVLESRYSETWSAATEIAFLGARLNLYAYVLADNPPNSASNFKPEQDNIEFVNLGSRVAVRLLHIVCTSPHELVKGTQHTDYCVVYAVLFLLRIFGTAQKALMDETAVWNAISQTWTLMKGLSEVERDHMARICTIIEYVTNRADWSSEAPVPGKARSLMANNFVADVVIRARQRYHAHTESGAELPAPHSETDEANFPTWPEFGFEDQDMLLAEFGDIFGLYGLS